ncbi:MAG: hypothetical protein K2L94_03255 [Alphaproteobacteria bacterium]|nr:hypothetical protein [Alphaproteobacteria bacterium]
MAEKMKYVNQGQFSTQQMSIDETITELDDVIAIAMNILTTLDVPENAAKEMGVALLNLKEARTYIPYIRKKVEIAIKSVPADIQEQEYL